MPRKNDPTSLSPATRAAQALRILDPVTGAVTPGIELAATFARDENYEPRQDYIYARDGGPTTVRAEAVLADLDGAAKSFVFTSGLSALTTMFETLNPGDHVVAQRIMYHGCLAWLRHKAARHSIELSLFDQADQATLAETIRPGKTKIIWIETPCNPTWDIIDIEAAAQVAHNAGALLVVDSTIAPPCTTQPLKLGADVVFHSATKYLGGHSDLTAGVLSLRDENLIDELQTIRTLMGTALGAFEAWLLIRGMRTLFLRYERASQNALQIARHFEGHPAIAQVMYPGLPSHPGHAVATRQMTSGFGGMMSIRVNGGEDIANKVARTCKVFIPATSLGSVESLIEHRKAVEPPESEVPGDLLRISVGVEDVEDLIGDLEEALS